MGRCRNTVVLPMGNIPTSTRDVRGQASSQLSQILGGQFNTKLGYKAAFDTCRRKLPLLTKLFKQIKTLRHLIWTTEAQCLKRNSLHSVYLILP